MESNKYITFLELSFLMEGQWHWGIPIVVLIIAHIVYLKSCFTILHLSNLQICLPEELIFRP